MCTDVLTCSPSHNCFILAFRHLFRLLNRPITTEFSPLRFKAITCSVDQGTTALRSGTLPLSRFSRFVTKVPSTTYLTIHVEFTNCFSHCFFFCVSRSTFCASLELNLGSQRLGLFAWLPSFAQCAPQRVSRWCVETLGARNMSPSWWVVISCEGVWC